jgi:hypothetical protein
VLEELMVHVLVATRSVVRRNMQDHHRDRRTQSHS